MAKTKNVLVAIDEAQLLDFKEVSQRFKKYFGIPVTLSSLVRHSLWNYLAIMEYLINNILRPWTREKVLDYFLKLSEKQKRGKKGLKAHQLSAGEALNPPISTSNEKFYTN